MHFMNVLCVKALPSYLGFLAIILYILVYILYFLDLHVFSSVFLTHLCLQNFGHTFNILRLCTCDTIGVCMCAECSVSLLCCFVINYIDPTEFVYGCLLLVRKCCALKQRSIFVFKCLLQKYKFM